MARLALSGMRTRAFNIGALLLTTVLGSSCYSVYTVERANPEHPKGIPFFAKRMMAEQTTTYVLSWYEVTAVEKPLSEAGTVDPKAPERKAVWLARQSTWDPEIVTAVLNNEKVTSLDELHKELSALFISADKIASDLAFSSGHNTPQAEPTFDVLTKSMTANTVKVFPENDYDSPYEINIDAPYSGTASGTIKLGVDGSLSEATVSVDTKLTDVLPLKGALESALGFGPLDAKPKRKVAFAISIEQKGYVYSFSAKQPANKLTDTPLSPLRFLPWVHYFESKPIGAATPESDPSKTATFSGAVKLPKEKN